MKISPTYHGIPSWTNTYTPQTGSPSVEVKNIMSNHKQDVATYVSPQKNRCCNWFFKLCKSGFPKIQHSMSLRVELLVEDYFSTFLDESIGFELCFFSPNGLHDPSWRIAYFSDGTRNKPPTRWRFPWPTFLWNVFLANQPATTGALREPLLKPVMRWRAGHCVGIMTDKSWWCQEVENNIKFHRKPRGDGLSSE